MEERVDIQLMDLESKIVYSPFDEAFAKLTKKGYEVISLPENAQLRIRQGIDHNVSRNGNFTREAVIYFPNSRLKPKLVRNSPLLHLCLAKIATETCRQKTDFRTSYLAQEQIEHALEDSTDFPELDLSVNSPDYEEHIEIPIDELHSNALTVWAFGGEKEARAYGEFLRNAGIKKMPIWGLPKHHVEKWYKMPFARQVWFGLFNEGRGSSKSAYDVLGRKSLYGGLRGDGCDSDIRGLHCDVGLRGIKKISIPLQTNLPQ